MKKKVIPTIFAENKKEFKKKFEKLIKLNHELQVDFMDGSFVKTKSISLSEIPNLHKYPKIKFEAHLMVKNPEKYIRKVRKKGFKKIIFHIESKNSKKEIEDLINTIKKNNLKCWIAINPKTNIEKVREFMDQIDGLVFMGVKPGKEKQKFIQIVYNKIKRLKEYNSKIKIQVDGGINLKTAKKLKNLVDIVNIGSFINNSAKPKKDLIKIKKVLNKN